MEAEIQIRLSSYTSKILATAIEGIVFDEQDYRKPDASDPNWRLKVKMDVSQDNIVTVSCMAIGRSLHKANAEISIVYSKNNTPIEKKEKNEDDADVFDKRSGILLFKKHINL